MEASLCSACRALLLATVLFGASLAVPWASAAPVEDIGELAGPPPHPSITITGPEGFEQPLSGVRSGDGTPEDPYRISNWTVAATEAWGVWLANTSAHVVIEDLVVEARPTQAAQIAPCPPDPALTCRTSVGIHVENATNVTIRSVRVTSAVDGIVLDRVRDVTVATTRLADVQAPEHQGFERGLSLLGSERVRISNLTVEDAVEPMRLEASRAVTLSDGHASGWEGLGHILASEVEDVRVERLRTEGTGIRLAGDATGFSIHRSRIIASDAGIEQTGGELRDVDVCGVQVGGVSGPGWAIALEADGLGFAGNTVLGTSNGVALAGEDVRVERNRIENVSGSWFAALDVDADGLQVTNNSIANNNLGANLRGSDILVGSNWWGDPSGPSGFGDGDGDALVIGLFATNVTWLEHASERPALGPDAAACPGPDLPPGAKRIPDLGVDRQLGIGSG